MAASKKNPCTIESYCFPEHFWPSNWSRSTLFRAFFSPIIGFGRGLVATTFHRASSHAAERGKCPRHQCINVVETLLYSSLLQLNWTQTLLMRLPVPEKQCSQYQYQWHLMQKSICCVAASDMPRGRERRLGATIKSKLEESIKTMLLVEYSLNWVDWFGEPAREIIVRKCCLVNILASREAC